MATCYLVLFPLFWYGSDLYIYLASIVDNFASSNFFPIASTKNNRCSWVAAEIFEMLGSLAGTSSNELHLVFCYIIRGLQGEIMQGKWNTFMSCDSDYLHVYTWKPPVNKLNQIDSPSQLFRSAFFCTGKRQVFATPPLKLQWTCTASLLQPPLGSIQ